jgi:hypothetical protein
MWRMLLITAASAVGVCLSVTVGEAQHVGVGINEGANVHANAGIHGRSHMMTSRTRTSFSAHARARGPEFRPHGWSEGRKTGWHCRVGSHGCIPPGLR